MTLLKDFKQSEFYCDEIEQEINSIFGVTFEEFAQRKIVRLWRRNALDGLRYDVLLDAYHVKRGFTDCEEAWNYACSLAKEITGEAWFELGDCTVRRKVYSKISDLLRDRIEELNTALPIDMPLKIYLSKDRSDELKGEASYKSAPRTSDNFMALPIEVSHDVEDFQILPQNQHDFVIFAEATKKD